MSPQRITLRVNCWYDEHDIEVAFPSNWEVAECRMLGHNRPALTAEQMRATVQRPIGSPRLAELAKGKKEVVILFDDLPKPTPAKVIVPFVLEELHAGGITDDHIRFLCAPATHRPLMYPEFVAKLGADIVERYPVYNHNVYEHHVLVGTTSRGTPVKVNREFASCDLRVAIGGIIPHPSAGYGGGGKIVLPGVASIDTIEAHHKHFTGAAKVERGRVHDNDFRLDIEEAARIAGLHFKVDAVLNNRREVVGLFAGDFVEEHREGVKLATEVYSTEVVKGAEVVVINTYPDECQFVRSTWCVPTSLNEGGDVVMVIQAHEGQNLHHYGGQFGTDYGGRGWSDGFRAKLLAKAGRVLVFAPFLSLYDRKELGWPNKDVVLCKDWGEVMAQLAERHGAGTKVAVYPYASLQTWMPQS
ncbi:MAG: lactate racemase domain-containing protein [Chloroflexi bacterium]|nr:lactate racemase domain-containing protein [Chloroflexota bacterium]